MKATNFSNIVDIKSSPNLSLIDRVCKKLFFSQLKNIQNVHLRVIENDSTYEFGEPENLAKLSTTIEVIDSTFYVDVVCGGSVGAAESYIRGKWKTRELTQLVRLFVVNMTVLDRMEGGVALLSVPVRKLLHLLKRNSRSGSYKNIAAHYDIGNEFFRLFLDERMMYSSAAYRHKDMTLEEASEEKLFRICQKLQLSPSDHILEIGTGWGGLCIYVAQNYGCKVTTTTISKEQFNYTCEKIQLLGLEKQIAVLNKDYRDLSGTYDKVISVEMIEAVGHQYLDEYFKKCSSLLKPDGLMAIQAITIADQRYRRALKSVDFIQKYIFPGSFIPSITAMLTSISRSSDMKLFHLEDIGKDYAKTLRAWRKRFLSKSDKVTELGYDAQFQRMWEFYLCYCEGGFEERALSNVQMILSKPQNQRPSILPSL